MKWEKPKQYTVFTSSNQTNIKLQSWTGSTKCKQKFGFFIKDLIGEINFSTVIKVAEMSSSKYCLSIDFSFPSFFNEQ